MRTHGGGVHIVTATSAVLVLLSLFLCSHGYAQAPEEPQILVLTPNHISYDPSLEKEITTQTAALRLQQNTAEIEQFIGSTDYQNLSDRRKQFFQDFKTLSEGIDFFKNISLTSANYLSSIFAEKFPSPVITVKDLKSNGSPQDLKAIYDREHFQYILNITDVSLNRYAGQVFASIKIQLYDGFTGSVPLEKQFMGNGEESNPNLSCDDRTISCAINNALSLALADVVGAIYFLSESVRDERKIEQERYLQIITNYFSAPYDKDIILSALKQNDNSIERNSLFQGLYSPAQDKFIAFFARDLSTPEAIVLRKKIRDRTLTIKVAPEYTGPQVYAYVVVGLRENGRWYYQKKEQTYFAPKDSLEGNLEFFNTVLQGHSFFKPSSTEADPAFWESNFFIRVTDLRKDPLWSIYGAGIWKNIERENRPYLGQYEIVADELRRERKEAYAKGDSLVKDTAFVPFYAKLRSTLGLDYTLAVQANSYPTFIYPNDRSLFLNPVVFKDQAQQRVLRYYVYLPKEKQIYEWTYLPVAVLDSNAWFVTQIIGDLKKAVEWNHSYSSLDNAAFWQNFVLKREGKGYKYLKNPL